MPELNIADLLSQLDAKNIALQGQEIKLNFEEQTVSFVELTLDVNDCTSKSLGVGSLSLRLKNVKLPLPIDLQNNSQT